MRYSNERKQAVLAKLFPPCECAAHAPSPGHPSGRCPMYERFMSARFQRRITRVVGACYRGPRGPNRPASTIPNCDSRRRQTYTSVRAAQVDPMVLFDKKQL